MSRRFQIDSIQTKLQTSDEEIVKDKVSWAYAQKFILGYVE